MAKVKLRKKPKPVKLHPKVVKAIACEATMDINWEGLHEDDPVALIAAYERIGSNVEYIEMLLSGELTEAWAVLQCQGQLSEERERIATHIGQEILRTDAFKKDVDRAEVKKEIKQARKWAKLVWAAWKDCGRFWKETREYDDDQEAAERLGLKKKKGGK
jgi:hypothetical protein